ncbi:MAG: flagellar biosynthesis protein FliQ [Chloroflexota bacterium]|mgnify:CR=1 FL=1|nr:flagellar biosynthesis protein FliQ [Dehalococcoidia bacterium]MDW8047719.1 flagellar biosynthesis protein FliQ [Chloroflexota bacterium]
MNESVVLALAKETLWITFLVGAPILGVTMVIGIAISIFQAVTQINEMTLTFVPKIVGVFVALIIFGPWMLETIVSFTSALFSNLAMYGR